MKYRMDFCLLKMEKYRSDRNMGKHIISFLITLCLLPPYTGFAQRMLKSERNADIVEFSSRDGLPTTNISNIVQTNDGYIWISGIEGTYRFDGYEFDEVGEDFGVPKMQNIFYDTTKNMLYFASSEKFILFDGQTFSSFTDEQGYKINGMPGQVITFIKADSRGRIWIGSETPYVDKENNGGLTCFENDHFTVYDSSSFPLDNATNFIETPFSDLIFLSSGKNTQSGEGGYIALYKQNRFQRIDENVGISLQNPSNLLLSTINNIDNDGNTWIAFMGILTMDLNNLISHTTGVLKYDGTNFIEYPGLEKYLKPGQQIQSVAYSKYMDRIYATTSRSDGVVFSKDNTTIFELKKNEWVPSDFFRKTGTLTDLKTGQPIKDFKYVFSYLQKENKFFPESIDFIGNDSNLGQSSRYPNQIFSLNTGAYNKYDALNGLRFNQLDEGILLGTQNGFGIYYPNNSRMYTQNDGILNLQSFIPKMYTDRNGLVWISYSFVDDPAYFDVSDVGLNVWDGNKFRTFTKDNGLPSNLTFNTFQDSKKRVWIPTAEGIAMCREIRNSNKEWLFKFSNILTDNKAKYNVTNLLETDNGHIYAWQNYVRPNYGPLSESIFYLAEFDGEKFKSIKTPFSAENQAKKYQQYELIPTNTGTLWLEGQFSNELKSLTSAPSEIMVYDGQNWQQPPGTWQKPDDQLHYVGRLDNGLYFLTSSGFYRFANDRFVNLIDSVTQYADYRILRGASVVGTMTNIQSGNRLYIRLRSRGLAIYDGVHLNFYTKKDGLPSTNLYNPTPDPVGNLIFSHPSGALVIHGEKFQAYYDDESIVTGGANVTTLDGDGNLLMFYKGVGIYVRKKQQNSFPLKLTSVSVNGEKYYYKYPDKMPYNKNSLLFNYAALNFRNPKQTIYEHFLDGFDKNWSKAGNLSFTEYQNLPPGNYTFKVQGTTANGIKTNMVSHTFKITPPFWRTWWAYGSYIFFIALLLISIRKYEKNRLRKEQETKLEKERTTARIKEAELKAKAAEAEKKILEVENERKSRELEEARRLQISMLPREIPKLPNLEIAVYMKTATEVGGDYYDFSLADDGSINIGIGDATGHGMKAGTLVSAMKALFTAQSLNLDIESFFSNANLAFKQMKMERVMMGFAMLKIKGSTITMVNAGMPPIFIYRKNDKQAEEIELHFAPLGALEESLFKSNEIKVNPGDTLLLLSDGMPELVNDVDDMFGYERIKSSFEEVAEQEPAEIIDFLQRRGSDWVNNEDPKDDVTFVVLKVK
jgi:serine phosphatase RsbU (regulator of sigma subunit)